MGNITDHISTKERRRLFVRLTENLPPLRLTARDVRILELAYEYRFFTAAHVRALIGGSKRNLTERLSRMYHHGYLDRPKQQLTLRLFGYRDIIYALARPGARVLARYRQDNRYLKPRWTENNNAVKAPQFLHTLMISDFRACLTLACRSRPDLSLAAWDTPATSLAKYRIDRREVWVKPDAHFVLALQRDGVEHRAHFFLECDRGTMTYANFRRKLAAYWSMRRNRMLVSGSIPRAYRVLTVGPSPARTRRLMRAAVDADPRRAGSLMFYFCSQTDYDLNQPNRILAPIWRSPADTRFHSLLEGKGGENVPR